MGEKYNVLIAMEQRTRPTKSMSKIKSVHSDRSDCNVVSSIVGRMHLLGKDLSRLFMDIDKSRKILKEQNECE